MENADLIEATRAFNRFYTDQLGLLNQHILDSDYSLSEARVLYEINRFGECSSVALNNLLSMDPGYLSRLLKAFERDGLVSKRKSAHDARSQLVSLTSQGKQLFQQLDTQSDAQIASLVRKLSPAEQTVLMESLGNIRYLLGESTQKPFDLTVADITIRTDLRSGDIGYVTYLHGLLYRQEYNYDVYFESYVAEGLHEFVQQYHPDRSRAWLCEHRNRIIGCLFLMDRGEAAQLRYFLLEPSYRGVGLGGKLMKLYMDFFRATGYQSSYLWTTSELPAAAHLYKRYGFQLSEEKYSTAFGKPLTEQRYDLK